MARTKNSPNRRSRITGNAVQDVTIKFRASKEYKEVLDLCIAEALRIGMTRSQFLRRASMSFFIRTGNFRNPELLERVKDQEVRA